MKAEKYKGTKKFILYFSRWELSSLVLAPCMYLLPYNFVVTAIISNAIGACIFFWVDKWIFKEGVKA